VPVNSHPKACPEPGFSQPSGGSSGPRVPPIRASRGHGAANGGGRAERRRLEPSDLEVLDGPVHRIGWYDIRIVTRLLKLLLDVEGGGSKEYLRQHGAAAADRLFEAELYPQLEYLNRAQVEQTGDAHERVLAFGRDLRLFTTLRASIYNFGRWQAKPDPADEGRYMIEVIDASAFPDALCWTPEGLINRMATKLTVYPATAAEPPTRSFIRI
jgi:hypothetical protein